VSTLETIQEEQAAFTSNKVYAHLRRFEEILKQTDVPMHA
jgi:hypothetical protein